ncbi:MAG: GNAT family N-acetyltransferase, partial [Acholeplasmatales bacterium]|nr:GNAT family N-acetyltransferase [Acholeplasmatales bacterium]
MGIIYSNDINKLNKGNLLELYGNSYDYLEAFKNSNYLLALDNDKLVGAIRYITEGIETALVVDLKVNHNNSYEIKKNLIKGIEDKLIGKRIMFNSNLDDIDLLEELGYNRCKNAWTYLENAPDLKNSNLFLPLGFSYLGEEKTRKGKDKINENIKYEFGYNEEKNNEINDVLSDAFGHLHDVNKTKEAFINSQYVILAYIDNKLVGVARALGDSKLYATILNVAVSKEYQGLGIGTNIILRLSKEIKEKLIILNTHPGAVGFYNSIKEYRRNKYLFERRIPFLNEEIRIPKDNSFFNKMFTEKGFRFK